MRPVARKSRCKQRLFLEKLISCLKKALRSPLVGPFDRRLR